MMNYSSDNGTFCTFEEKLLKGKSISIWKKNLKEGFTFLKNKEKD